MPIKKYSAMDPGGTFRPDAMDQVEQWNANRGDQWNQFNINRSDRSADVQRQAQQDDWRREVALQQLGLSREVYQGGRQDSAAARQSENDWRTKQFDYMQGRDASGDSRWQQGFDLNKRGVDMQYSEAERLAKERADEAAALDAMDFSQLGAGADYAKAAPRGLKAQIAAQMLTRGMDKAMRPEDRASRGEDVRGSMALQNLSQLEQKGMVTPRESTQYAMAQAEATKQGYGGTGGIAPQQIKVQEFAKQQARTLVQKAKELGAGAFGYVSDNDVDIIAQQAQDLKSILEQAGYPRQDINAVIQQIAEELAKTRQGTLIKQGWGQEDIASALGMGQ